MTDPTVLRALLAMDAYIWAGSLRAPLTYNSGLQCMLLQKSRVESLHAD